VEFFLQEGSIKKKHLHKDADAFFNII